MSLRLPTSNDIFISYKRGEGNAYADGLSAALTNEGFRVYYDRLGVESATKLSPYVIKELTGCRMLVVIATREALESIHVKEEIARFTKAHGSDRIVPIYFDPQLLDGGGHNSIIGLAPELEDSHTLESGTPSSTVVARIDRAYDFTRSKRRLRNYTIGAVTVFATLTLLSAGLSVYAYAQLTRGKKALEEAEAAELRAARAEAQAAEKEQIAERKTLEAVQAATVADEAEQKRIAAEGEAAKAEGLARSANRQRQLAERDALVEGKRAQEFNREAKKQQEIALVRQLANRSSLLLRQGPDQFVRGVLYSLEAAKKAKNLPTPVMESDLAVRASLARLSHQRGEPKIYEGEIMSSSLSPDANFVVVVKSTGVAEVYRNGRTERAEFTVNELLPEASHVAVCSEARRLATANRHTVRVQDVTNGKVLWEKSVVDTNRHPKGDGRKATEEESIGALALSPNGKYLAVTTHVAIGDIFKAYSSNVGAAEVWDVDTGQIIADLGNKVDFEILSVAFNGGGNLLALGGVQHNSEGDAGRALIWEISDGMDGRASFDRSPKEISFARKVTAIAAGTAQRTIVLAAGHNVFVLRPSPSEVYEPTALIPLTSDVQSIALRDHDTTVSLLRDGQDASDLFVKDIINPGQTSHSYKRITENWDAAGMTYVSEVPYPEAIRALWFQPGSYHLTAIGKTNDLRVWDTTTSEELPAERISPDSPNETVKLVSSRFVITSSGESVKIRDVMTKEKLPLLMPSQYVVRTDKFSITQDGKILVITGSILRKKEYEPALLVFKASPEGYELIHTFDPLAGPSQHISLSSDGHLLAIKGEKQFRIQDLDTGRDVTPKPLKKFEGPVTGIYGVQSFVFAPEANLLLTVLITDHNTRQDVRLKGLTADDTLIAWDTHSWRRVSEITFSSNIEAYSVSSNGRFMAVGTISGEAKIADLMTGKVVALSLQDPVRLFLFSPDSNLLAALSGSGTVTLFESRTGVEASLLEHEWFVSHVVFSSDSRYLATASSRYKEYQADRGQRRQIQVWAINPGELSSEVCGRLGRLMNNFYGTESVSDMFLRSATHTSGIESVYEVYARVCPTAEGAGIEVKNP